MRIKHFVITGLLIFVINSNSNSQEIVSYQTGEMQKGMTSLQKNKIKINGAAFAFKSVNIQYERKLFKNVSAAVTVRTMPYTSFTLAGFLNNQISDEHKSLKAGIDKVKVGNIAVTPEIRLYLNEKNNLSGWYLAPFYRYSRARMKEMTMLFENSLGEEVTATINGDYTSMSGGLVLGRQFMIGRSLSLDLWFGPSFGKGKILIEGTTNESLTKDDQADIRAEFTSWDIPMASRKASYSVRDISVQFKGTNIGLNSGISLGFCF